MKNINKHFKVGFLLLIMVGFIVFTIHSGLTDRKAKEKFIEKNYHGIINEIIHTKNDGGFPYVKINNDLIYFGMNEVKVRGNIKIGDSIVKESGTKVIIVYSRGIDGEWHEKVYK